MRFSYMVGMAVIFGLTLAMLFAGSSSKQRLAEAHEKTEQHRYEMILGDATPASGALNRIITLPKDIGGLPGVKQGIFELGDDSGSVSERVYYSVGIPAITEMKSDGKPVFYGKFVSVFERGQYVYWLLPKSESEIELEKK